MTSAQPPGAADVTAFPALEPARLARAERREVLLDAAYALVAAGDVSAVSVESVADRAGVSRPLVYKHFANRSDILSALYLREAERLHEDLSAEVLAAGNVEDMYRELFRGSLRAAEERGPIFEALRAAGGLDPKLRQIQEDRDRQTVAFYARQAVKEFGLPKTETEAATAMLLAALAPALKRWHARPTRDYALVLEHAYMCIVSGSLAELRRRNSTRARRSRKSTDN